jgi:hypothetical protein
MAQKDIVHVVEEAGAVVLLNDQMNKYNSRLSSGMFSMRLPRVTAVGASDDARN